MLSNASKEAEGDPRVGLTNFLLEKKLYSHIKAAFRPQEFTLVVGHFSNIRRLISTSSIEP